jgi:hypothetical protein
MAAAAYAKDLLNRIVPSRIENEQRMSELFSTGQSSLSTGAISNNFQHFMHLKTQEKMLMS